ncbi:hypothetical protein AKJ16_DCAP20606 [Drosera capensis]
MAETMENNAAFWLPSHFLNDDNFADSFDPALSSYPPATGRSRYLSVYGSSSSALDSPVSSNGSETETDRDEFLAELTRQLARFTLLDSTQQQQFHKLNHASSRNVEMATSPQSTLAGYAKWATSMSGDVTPNGGYPSRGKSPPAPDAWDQVYAAAIQVARMKRSAAVAAAAAQEFHHENKGILALPRNPLRSTFPVNNGGGVLPRSAGWYNYPHMMNDVERVVGHCGLQQRQQQTAMRTGRLCDGGGRCGACGSNDRGGGGGALGLPPSAWPPLRNIQQERENHNIVHPVGSAMRNPYAGVGIKRQSTGTGVFLPRKYGTTLPAAAEPRKKPAGSTVMLPARMARQALNLSIEDTNPHTVVHHHQSLVPESEVIIAKRNAAAEAAAVAWAAQQQRRSMMTMRAAAERPSNHEITRLPQEWTY